MLDYLHANSGGGGGAVNSVNGQTGDVVLYGSDILRSAGSNSVSSELNNLNDNLEVVGDAVEEIQTKPVQASSSVTDIKSNTEALVTKDYADAHYQGGGGDDKVDKASFDFEEGKVDFDTYEIYMTEEEVDMVPTLQQVTDAGAITNNRIIVEDESGNDPGLSVIDTTNNHEVMIDPDSIVINGSSAHSSIITPCTLR